MKTAKVVLAVVIGFALMASVAFAADPKYSGFLGDNYKNLQPGPEGGAKMRWMKPGVMFGNHNKFMVDSVIFFFADDCAPRGFTEDEGRPLRAALQGEALNHLTLLR